MQLNHIAIILDGNGRWAKKRKLPVIEGHRQGAKQVHKIIEAAIEFEVKYLTLYIFSAENWRRPKEEVDHLMSLLRFYLRAEFENLHKNNIKVKFIGDIQGLDLDIQNDINKCEELTKDNKSLNLTLAVNYGGKQEIIRAVNNLVKDASGGVVTEDMFASYLYTADIPDPDLVIRTSGEKRVSNFLLWQAAYAELYFTDILWPDFNKEDLKNAINEFKQRERRYGTR